MNAENAPMVMQNRPELVRSHKPPNQVVRMLVLSNMWYCFTIGRVAVRSGRWPEHAFSFFKNDANQRETVKLGNMSKLWSHTNPMTGVLSMLALSIDHIDHHSRLADLSGPLGTLKLLRSMPINDWDFHFLRLKKNDQFLGGGASTTFFFLLLKVPRTSQPS